MFGKRDAMPLSRLSCCKVLKRITLETKTTEFGCLMDLVAHCNALLIRFEAAHQYNNMTDKNFKDVICNFDGFPYEYSYR